MSSSPRRIISTCSGPAGRDARCRGGTASRRAAMVPVPVRSDRNRQSICMCRTASWRLAIRVLDFGFIKTARPFQGLPGVFPLAALSNARLQQVRSRPLLHIAGYPCDKPHGNMWQHAERLDRFTPHSLYYSVDTGRDRTEVRSGFGAIVPATSTQSASMSAGRRDIARTYVTARFARPPRNQSRRADHARTDRDGPDVQRGTPHPDLAQQW